VSRDIEEYDEGLWKVGAVYVLHRPGMFVRRSWWVLTKHGALSFETREQAFGKAAVEAIDA
jgi:hypothetical protein